LAQVTKKRVLQRVLRYYGGSTGPRCAENAKECDRFFAFCEVQFPGMTHIISDQDKGLKKIEKKQKGRTLYLLLRIVYYTWFGTKMTHGGKQVLVALRNNRKESVVSLQAALFSKHFDGSYRTQTTPDTVKQARQTYTQTKHRCWCLA
jgi:hypothetical protein